MTRPQHRKPKRPKGEYAPTAVRVHLTLIEAVRARYPVARDWSDSQVAAACIAMALAVPVQRTGHVHSE